MTVEEIDRKLLALWRLLKEHTETDYQADRIRKKMDDTLQARYDLVAGTPSVNCPNYPEES